MVTVGTKLKRGDLRRGVYFTGPEPTSGRASLWTYSHATKDKGGVAVFWFTNCRQDWGHDPVSLSWRQVERLSLLSRPDAL